MMATMSDAHREWHLNAGVPIGQPGCPQDACHLPDEDEGQPFVEERDAWFTVRCGNRKAHPVPAYHISVTAVRDCYAEVPPVLVSTPAPPAPTKPRVDWDTIPVGGAGYGFYALEDADKEVRFFRVERPKAGKWKGRTFIKEQAGSDLFPIEPRQRAYGYLTRIAEDPEAAGLLYAEKINACSRCGRTLTDATSRALGLGPDCAKKGW